MQLIGASASPYVEHERRFLQKSMGDVIGVTEDNHSRHLSESVRYSTWGYPILVPMDTRHYADFNGDGDSNTDADITAFFDCLRGDCCENCESVDVNRDGDIGTDADIEEYFNILAGHPTAFEDISDNRFGFRGYWWDSHLELYHVRHRVYDPLAFRWLQPDPAGFVDGMNLYAYCNGDPINGIDPFGLEKWEWYQGWGTTIGYALGFGPQKGAAGAVWSGADQGYKDARILIGDSIAQSVGLVYQLEGANELNRLANELRRNNGDWTYEVSHVAGYVATAAGASSVIALGADGVVNAVATALASNAVRIAVIGLTIETGLTAAAEAALAAGPVIIGGSAGTAGAGAVAVTGTAIVIYQGARSQPEPAEPVVTGPGPRPSQINIIGSYPRNPGLKVTESWLGGGPVDMITPIEIPVLRYTSATSPPAGRWSTWDYEVISYPNAHAYYALPAQPTGHVRGLYPAGTRLLWGWAEPLLGQPGTGPQIFSPDRPVTPQSGCP